MILSDRVMIVTDENGKRFREILESPDADRLHYPGHRVFSVPTASERYANCNAVVLLSCRYVGLSHYHTEKASGQPTPEEYVPDLIMEVSDLAGGREGLIAVLIGGDRKHFERNKRILLSYNIPIVGEYVDGWKDGKHFYDHPKEVLNKIAHKQLVVSPSTQEVIMYSPPVGFVKLK